MILFNLIKIFNLNMSVASNCIVAQLLQKFTRQELLGEMNDILLRQITRCKCADHINENPVELPQFADLNGQVVAVLSELLDWGLDNLSTDRSGEVHRLVSFIDKNCLSNSPNSLFSILNNLESIYR